MMNRATSFLCSAASAMLLLTACTDSSAQMDAAPQMGPTPPTIERIELATEGKAGEPHLTRGPDGEVLASWIERHEQDSRMLFARFQGGMWSEKTEIARGDNWFVNWADVPSIAVSDAGTLMAHWLERLGEDRYAYGVRFALSRDDGTSWGEEAWLHEDRSPTEHGFVSIVPTGDGFMTTWLDGNRYDTGENEMSVHARRVFEDGRLGEEAVIDRRTCDCCPTALTRTGPDSFSAFFRDRSENDIRDIAVAQYEGGAWSDPVPIHEDGWMIQACPVNGPASDYDTGVLGVAWFTMSEGSPTVFAAFSESNGVSFSEPIRADIGNPTGRVAARMRSPDELVLVWMESGGEDQSGIFTRSVFRNGDLGEAVRVTRSSTGRAAGYPRLENAGEDMLLMWTEPGDVSTLASVKISW